MAVQGERIKVLGKGSYGVVYLVRTIAPVSDELYAVKAAPMASSVSLILERNILQQFIGCNHIIQCFGGFESIQTGDCCLFLEYASGGSLLDLMMNKYGGKIPERDAKCYARMIVEGLAHIHRKGFIHSDLKPDNILVFPSRNGVVLDTLKIADFGLVKQYGVEDTRIWEHGFRGTPSYMSPESVLGEVTGALDIWSLGCIVVEMITGELPFAACGDREELRDKLLSGESPKIPENMSKSGKNFLMKCLDRDPNKRWTSEKLLRHPYLLQAERRRLAMVQRSGLAICQQLCNSSLQQMPSPPGFSRFERERTQRRLLGCAFRL